MLYTTLHVCGAFMCVIYLTNRDVMMIAVVVIVLIAHNYYYDYSNNKIIIYTKVIFKFIQCT